LGPDPCEQDPLPVPANENVGSVEGTASVSGGKASYQVPITVAPGRRGVQPGVNLSYGQGGGNGPVGVGWSLNAASRITRCARTYAQDGLSRAVDFTANDKLCLDGQRLILISGGYGQPDSEYRTEIESFNRIYLRGGMSNPLSTFEVQSKSGALSYYGGTQATEMFEGTPWSWWIETTEDQQSNSLRYVYLAYPGGAQLHEIRYTGFNGVDGDRKVRFEYQNRPDREVGYERGHRSTSLRRLTGIVSEIGTTLVRRYNLGYTQSRATNRSLLYSIEECSDDGCLPKTIFNYQDEVATYTWETAPGGEGMTAIVGLAADYDGDGSKDYLRQEVPEPWGGELVSMSIINYPSLAEEEILGGVWGEGFSIIPGSAPGAHNADFDGDGRADLVGVRNNYLVVRNAEGDETSTDLPVVDSPVLSESADFDGDGKTDLMLALKPGLRALYLQCEPATNGSLRFCRSAILPGLVDQAITQTTDFDGDGLLDFIADWDGSAPIPSARTPPLEPIVIYTRESGGNFYFEIKTIVELGGPTGSFRQYPDQGFIDVNGDGLLDVYDLPGPIIWLNSGTELIPVPVTNPVTMPPRFWDDVIIGDDDGDGRASMLIPNDVVYGWCSYVWKDDEEHSERLDYCSTPGHSMPFTIGDAPQSSERTVFRWDAIDFDFDGTQGFAIRRRPTNIEAPLGRTSLEDHFGDGLLDARFRMQTTWGQLYADADPIIIGEYDGSYQGGYGTKVLRNRGPLPDLLKVATNGLGAMSQWQYAVLSSAGVAACNSPQDIPFYEIGPRAPDTDEFLFVSSMAVVAYFEQSNGIGGLNGRCYRYKDAKIDANGRGFLGFGTIIEEENLLDGNDLRTTTLYHQSYPLTGSEREISTARTTDPLNALPIQKSVTEWHAQQRGPQWFKYAANVIETSRDLHTRGWISTSTQSYEFQTSDDLKYGNVSLEQVRSEDLVSRRAQRLSVTFDYSDAGDWWINKAVRTEATADPVEYEAVPVMIPFGTFPENSAKTVVTEIEYQNDRLPSFQVVQPGSPTDSNRTDFDSYDVYGNATQTTLSAALASPRTIEQTYDPSGYFQTSVINSLDQTTTYTFDPRTGENSVESHPNGHTTAKLFDGFGRLIQVDVTGTASKYIRYTNCGYGCVRVLAQQNGAPTTIQVFDLLGRPRVVTRSGYDGELSFFVESKIFDARGRVLELNNGPQQTRFKDYDALGRVGRKIVEKAGYVDENGMPDETLETTYSHSGAQTRVVVDDRLTVYRTYDSRGFLVETIDALGHSTKYRYDGRDNLILVEDRDGNQLRSRFNATGQELVAEDPNRGTWTFSYDGFGQLRWQRDANGALIELQRDAVDRVTHRRINGALDASWAYDTLIPAMLSSETKYDLTNGAEIFKRELTYNALLQLTKSTVTFDGLAPYETQMAYDCKGLVRGIEYPNGEALKLEYRKGYLHRESNALARQPAQGIDVYREIHALSANGGIQQEYFGNALYRMTMEVESTGQVTEVCSGIDPLCTDPRQRLTYQYRDGFGNVTQQAKHFGPHSSGAAHASLVEETFTYDELHRLRGASRIWDGDESSKLNTAYDYSALGNIQSKSDYGASYVYGTPARTNPANAGPHAVVQLNKLGVGLITDFRYDANGNQIAGDGRTIAYTAFNKPSRIEQAGIVTTFAYDVNGQRYKQEAPGKTTRYIDGLYEETITANGDLEQKAYLGGSTIVTRTLTRREVRWLHKDRLGSIDLVTDENGDVVEEHSFDAFGMPRNTNWENTGGELHSGEFASEVTTRGFTGHEHLDQHRLIHMNGRAYDPALGRFLSVDPVIQGMSNPQALNAYSYILNNPLSGTDPSGFCYIAAGYSCEQTTETLERPTGSSIHHKRSTYTVTGPKGDKLVVIHDSSNGSTSISLNGKSVQAEDISDKTMRQAARMNESAGAAREKMIRDNQRYGGSLQKQMDELKQSLALTGLILQLGPVIAVLTAEVGAMAVVRLQVQIGMAKSLKLLNATWQLAEAGPAPVGAGLGVGVVVGAKVGKEVVEEVVQRGGPMLSEGPGKGVTKVSGTARKSIRTLERRIAEHEEKIAKFRAHPTVRPGMEKMSAEAVARQQQRRIEKLEKEIEKFRGNIEKIKEGKL
jgi:RHS repeat-associated protein